MRQVKIFCPKCEYVPQPSDLWSCVPACGCCWNTFETCGVCPKCGKNWEDTACPRCARWSPHADWYHEFLPDGEVETKAGEPAVGVRQAEAPAAGLRPRTGAISETGVPRWAAMAVALLLVLGMAGCKSEVVRPQSSIAIQGWVNAPGHYLIPSRPDVSINDLVRLADGLPVPGVTETEHSRRLGAELINQESGKEVSVKPAQWSVPLRDLKIEVHHYNRLKITLAPLR